MSANCSETDNRTLLDQLRARRTSDPQSPAFYTLSAGANSLEARSLTVEALLSEVESFAKALQSKDVNAGDRVLLSLAKPDAFLVSFLGSMAIGAIPVPLPSLSAFRAPRSYRERFEGVAEDCRSRLTIVDAVSDALPENCEAICYEDLRSNSIDTEFEWPSFQGEDTAFLQYTSGSTGAPKGVVITQANLSANCRAIAEASGFGSEDRMISWLPLHHDMGLVGAALSCLYSGVPTYVLPTLDFILQPQLWLQAISQFRGTLSVAPTFAYSLVSKRVSERDCRDLDLSSWRLAYVGAEPIPAETLQQFTNRYQEHGFSPEALFPVYGLAEATLAVAFPKPGSGMSTRAIDRQRLSQERRAMKAVQWSDQEMTIVSVGRAVPGHTVTIRNPETQAVLEERVLGEIVVEGPSISPRYFNEDWQIQRSELRTGDLGFLQDGELFVVDRLKDLIIIAGQNFAPSDIENELSRIEGLRKGRILAYSRPNSMGSSELCVLAEVKAQRALSLKTAEAEVKARSLALGISCSGVHFVAAGALILTSSGKLRRRASVEAFDRGEISPLLSSWDVLKYRWKHRGKRLILGALAMRARWKKSFFEKVKK